MFDRPINPTATRLDGSAHPLEVMRQWPEHEPLAVLHSGRVHERWARWSILASVKGWVRAFEQRIEWLDETGRILQTQPSADPVAALDLIFNGHPCPPDDLPDTPPFCGGWIGHLGYELGGHIEPKARREGKGEGEGEGEEEGEEEGEAASGWALWSMAWCPGALVFDHLRSQWWAVGDTRAQPNASRVSRNAEDEKNAWPAAHLGPLHPRQTRYDVEESVARAIEYIHAGDVFQVNIAQQFTASFRGSRRALFARAMETSPAWYGAYLDEPGDDEAALISISPELFLEFDPQTRDVITRPVKGTAPGHVDAAVLEASEKDRAELAMIVDLMRNDLGRVCEFGSVKVLDPRTIESHPTIHHGVATVRGRLRERASLTDLISATFPGGSITGAPKIRAMQIVNELEPIPRGPYCGAIGFQSLTGGLSLNIAIRTMLIRGSTLSYSAGGGIVADSRPDLEYEEMLAKAAAARRLSSPEEMPVVEAARGARPPVEPAISAS